MTQAKSGDTVCIHYTGKLGDGEVFDSSKDSDPLEFVLGSGQVIPGFDAGVTGMAVGESKTITIPSEQAYSPRNEDLVFQAPREKGSVTLFPAFERHRVSEVTRGTRWSLVAWAAGTTRLR